MGIPDALRTAWRISSRGARLRGLGVAAIATLERLCAPALAFVLLSHRPTEAVPAGLALAGTLAVRGAIERSFIAWNETHLYRRAVRSILGGDVLQPDLLPDEEARVTLFEGLFRVSRLFGDTIPNLLANVIGAVVLALAIAFVEPVRVVLVATAAVAVGGIVLFVSRRSVEAAQTAAWRAWERVAERVTDACDGRLDIVASGQDAVFLSFFEEAAGQWDQRARRAARLAGLLGRLPILLLALGVGAAVVVDTMANGGTWVDAVTRAAVLAATAPAFLGVSRCLQEIVTTEPRLRLVDQVLNSDRAEPQGRQLPPPAPACIDWRSLSYGYGSSIDVLHEVSFSWRRGEVLALSGPNGSGKSSCLRALLGLGEQIRGGIFVDGKPLLDMDLRKWRQMIGFLPQRPYLPRRGTVRDSFHLLHPGETDQCVAAALERVGLSGLASLDRRVGELSAGERQRVALARVLCRPSDLVVLDEPDANLDRAGVALLSEVLREVARGRMLLVVAHSAELLAGADRVVTLDHGRVRSGEEFALA